MAVVIDEVQGSVEPEAAAPSSPTGSESAHSGGQERSNFEVDLRSLRKRELRLKAD